VIHSPFPSTRILTIFCRCYTISFKACSRKVLRSLLLPALLALLVRLTRPLVVLRPLLSLLNEIGTVKGQNGNDKGMVLDRKNIYFMALAFSIHLLCVPCFPNDGRGWALQLKTSQEDLLNRIL
jgi:hypothetical protein